MQFTFAHNKLPPKLTGIKQPFISFTTVWISNGGWAQMGSSLGLGWTQLIRGQSRNLTHVWQLAAGWVLGLSSSKLAQARSHGGLRATTAVREIKPTCCSGFYLHHVCCSPIGQHRLHGQGQVCARGTDKDPETNPTGLRQSTIRGCSELTSRLRTKSFRMVFPPWRKLPILIQFNKRILWGCSALGCGVL